MKPKTKENYVDNKKLEQQWTHWINTKDEVAWDFMLSSIYKICNGVAVHFHPRSEEEHSELTHEAFILTIDKIKSGKLTFEPGRAPVFNLLTTTIFRHLYSKMTKESRRRRIMGKYRAKFLEKHPEYLPGASDKKSM